MLGRSIQVSLSVLALGVAGFSCESALSAPVALSIAPNIDPITETQSCTLVAQVDTTRINGSHVERVEFYQEGTELPIHVDETTPYEYSWLVDAQDNGVHRFFAIAYMVFEGIEATDAWSSNVLERRVEITPVRTTLPPDDLSPTDDPSLLGFLRGIGTAADVVVRHGEAWVASAEFGFVTIDVSNPSAPSFWGGVDQPFEGQLLAAQGNLVVVAGENPDGYATLWVIDVSDSETPAVKGQVTTTVGQGFGTGFQGIAIDASGSWALGAMGHDGLWVFDIRNPDAPSIAGTYDTPGTAFGIAVRDSHALLADGTGDLQVVSFANPAQPTLAGSLSFSGVARDLVLVNDRAYIADQQGGFKVVDVSSPTAPQMVGFGATHGFNFGMEGNDSWLVAYLNDQAGGRVEVLSLSNPVSPSSVKMIDVADFGGFALDGNWLYVADRSSGVRTYDLGQASSSPAATVDAGIDASAIAAEGDIVVLGGRLTGTSEAHLWTVDTSDPTQFVVVGELATTSLQGVSTGILDVVLDVSRNLAVAAAGTAGLWVIDISNLAAPTIVGTWDSPGTAYAVALSGSTAFIADGIGDLQIVSLANPTAPTFLANLSTSGVMRDVGVKEEYVYLANQQGGLKVIDVTDVTAPRLVGLASTTGYGFGVSVDGDDLAIYSPHATGGTIELFDIGSPTQPQQRASLPMQDARSVALSGGRAYVADGTQGLKIFDLAPSSPEMLATVPVLGDSRGVAVIGGRAFVADSIAGLAIVQ